MTDTADIPDLWQGACDGMFALLSASGSAALATIRQELDQNQQPPFVLIGDLDGSASGGKFEIADKLTIDVHTVYRGSVGRRGLLEIMWANRLALQNKMMTVDGISFSPLAWKSADTARGADGVTFVGLQQFEVSAEPA